MADAKCTGVRAECSIEGCARPIKTKGLCNPHYLRLLRHGDPLAGAKFRKPSGQPCSVEGCDSTAIRFDLCTKHAYRFKRYGDPETLRNATYGEPQSLIDMLVASPPNVDDCISWPYATCRLGYGLAQNKRVHREVLRRTVGEPPSDKHEAAHSCGQRDCCNVRHLRWATHTENMHDKRAHGTVGVKLTEAQAAAIYALEGSGKELAGRFGVSETTIHEIKTGRTWAWLTGGGEEG